MYLTTPLGIPEPRGTMAALGGVALKVRGWMRACVSSPSRRLESKPTTMRIGIVNDTVLAREALRRVVLSSSDHEVVWTANEGNQAIALAREIPPDLVLMDLFMPGTDGVEATRRIMGESPCAILIVTATVSGHLSKVYQAMGYGALDAIDTPTLGVRGEVSGAAVLLHKIELIGRLIGKPEKPARDRAGGNLSHGPVPVEPSLEPLVVLGASTGGPQALAEILGRLPRGWRLG